MKDKQKNNQRKVRSDSGNCATGSSSVADSSSTMSASNEHAGDSTTTRDTPSSSMSFCSQDSPLNQNVNRDSPMCLTMRRPVPLVLMMQGQLQSSTQSGRQCCNTLIFRCNMCNMFSDNLNDVLSHISSGHSSIFYCFVCSQFQNSKRAYDQHKRYCQTAQKAFQTMVDGHYNLQSNSANQQEQALNLSVVKNVALRAAQMVRNKKGRRTKIKNLLKCTYCKKAFFGQFYLQRHLRTHTGEKPCHCSKCGKGFVEWRNLKNHMIRFHNSSESADSGGQSKSPSPQNYSSSSSEGYHGRASVKPVVRSLPPPATTNTTSSPAQEFRVSETPNKIAADLSAGGPESRAPDSSPAQPFDNHQEQTKDPMSSVETAEDFGSQSQQIPVSTANLTTSPSAQKGNPVDNGLNCIKEDHSRSGTATLGTTSSRLVLPGQEDDLEASLNPVCSTEGDKFFQCQLCTKTFRTKFAMRRHIDFHTDKRPFQCDQCDYKAKTKPQLKVHALRHSGEKGFHCEVCSYACVTHSDLNRHCKSRTHRFRVALMEQQKPANSYRGPAADSGYGHANPTQSSSKPYIAPETGPSSISEHDSPQS